MSFINPFGLLAAALGGIIILMYLLKLKRKPENFSSTLLWLKSMEDLTANAPFQKLRQNLLMYLQILFLILLALALARPTMWLNRRTGSSLILLIDNSASMNAADGEPTRLDTARTKARELVTNMRRGDQMMLVTFGGVARVIQPFTAEAGTLTSSIRAIEPTDAESRIQEALLIVKGVRQVDPNVSVFIISDGNVGFMGNLIGEKDPVQFVRVGSGEDNRGITAFDIRESFEQKGQAQVFAEVENFSSFAAPALIKCLIDGRVEQAREAMIPAKGKQGFAFTGLEGNGKLVRVEIDGKDLLPSDDAVSGIVELNTEVRILLVSEGNFFLERMLALTPGANVSRVNAAEYDGSGTWDLVVLDQFAPKALAPGNYLFLNSVPPVEGFSREEETLKDQLAVDWNRIHPISRFLSFDALAAGETIRVKHPDWAVPVVESVESPLVLAGERQGLKLVCITFDVYSSDWPLQIGFPIFMTNAIQWLIAGGQSSLTAGYRCGETVSIQGRADLPPQVTITGPQGETWPLDLNESHLSYFSSTFHAGVYTIQQGQTELGRFAVNLLSPLESDVKPREEVFSGEQKIASTTISRENREVWPWFSMIGLLILAVEWHLYSRRSWL